MSCGSNDDELKLAKEYKYLLSCIRPLIDQLDKAKDAQLCLLWLSKLEQSASWERNYRNKILNKLCKQVKSNCLKPPFNAAPPSGALRNIVCGKDWKSQESNIECSELEFSTEEVASSSSLISITSLKNAHKHQPLSLHWKKNFSCNNRPLNPGKEVLDHSECFAIQKAYHERAQSDQMVIERYQEIIKSLVSQQLKADISPSRLKKLQSTYEIKIVELMHSVKKYQEENEVLKKKLECLGRELTVSDDLKQENENLKKQLSELEDAKNSLETKYRAAEEEKLMSLSDLIGKLNESEKKLNETEKRLQSVEKNYNDSYCNLENEYQVKMKELETKQLDEVSKYKKLLEEKDKELISVREQLTDQSSHFEEEISQLKHKLLENANCVRDSKKIRDLKTKARKLEKMKEHMTVVFQSQLQQILAKKDYYIASLEMQLKMNHCRPEEKHCISEFHNTLNEKINNLEAQYRKLLEESEQQFIKRRQLDLQKIHTLEKRLLSVGLMEEKSTDCDQLKSLSVDAFGDSSETGKIF